MGVKQWIKKKRDAHKQTWKYHFRIINPSDYECEFTFNAKNSLFMKIFIESQKRLPERAKTKMSPELVNEFDIPQEYHNLLKTNLRKPFSITSQDVASDHGFLFINYFVNSAKFKRNASDDWDIIISINGTYTKK